MEAIVLWAFVAVVQMQGLTGGAAGSLEQCVEARQQIITIHDIVAISECEQVTLKPVEEKK
jgi:hypothetical protein